MDRILRGALTTIASTLSALALCALSAATPASAEQISASGCSVSNTGYLRDLAREFEARTGVQVYVRGGGSVLGIEEISSGKVDFAASCRAPSPSDPKDIQFIQVAWDTLVPIVHPTNPVVSLSKAELENIMLGKLRHWKPVGGPEAPIKLFLSKSSKGLSGVESSIRALVLAGQAPVEGANVTPLASTGIVEQMVEATPEGFAFSGYTSARKRAVKMLLVDGVAPTIENILKGKYPYRRPLYLILPAKPTPAARAFVDFALSKEGQAFISSLGVVSLKDLRK